MTAHYISPARPRRPDVEPTLAERGLFADVIRPLRQSLEDVFFELTGEADE